MLVFHSSFISTLTHALAPSLPFDSIHPSVIPTSFGFLAFEEISPPVRLWDIKYEHSYSLTCFSFFSQTFIAYRLTAFPHFYCFVSHKSFNFIEAIVWKNDLFCVSSLSFSFSFFLSFFSSTRSFRIFSVCELVCMFARALNICMICCMFFVVYYNPNGFMIRKKRPQTMLCVRSYVYLMSTMWLMMMLLLRASHYCYRCFISLVCLFFCFFPRMCVWGCILHLTDVASLVKLKS